MSSLRAAVRRRRELGRRWVAARGRPGRGPGPGPRLGPRRREFVSLARELMLVVLLALALSWFLKTFLVQAFYIPSQSMEDTLLQGDRILVDKLTPGPRDLRRGDVVVFTDPGGWLAAAPEQPPVSGAAAVGRAARETLEFLGLAPAGASSELVKRVVGVGGDRLACCDAEGRLSVNVVPIEEWYLFPDDVPSEMSFSVKVPPGHLWVMGDHRSASGDSRTHLEDPRGGMVPLDRVIGRAFLVVWPPDRLERLQAPADLSRPPLTDGVAR